MKYLRSFIIGSGCFLGGFKQAKVDTNPIVSDSGTPLFCWCVPCHSNETAGIVGSKSYIAQVLCVGGLAEIFSFIVERISVYVFRFFIGAATKNLSRYAYRISLSCHNFYAGNIKAFSLCIPNGAPVPLVKPREISNINDGILVLRQGNKAVRLVKRLDDYVAFHVDFRHFPTSNGSVLSAAILL